MSPNLKKILKYIGIGIVSILILLFIAIEIILNFVLTPDKITPKFVTAVNDNLNAEFDVEALELSFFTTFPSFTIELHDGHILNELKDSIDQSAMPTMDTLLLFERAQVSVNPFAYMRNKIDITHVILDQPQIHALINSNADLNWNILKESQDVINDSIEDKSGEKLNLKIDLDDITINSGRVLFENEITEMRADIADLQLKIKAKYNSKKYLFKLKTDMNITNLWNKGEEVFNDLPILIDGKLEFDRKSKILNLDKTTIAINDIEFLTRGTLKNNKAEKQLEMDLNTNFAVNSLDNFMKILPNNVIDQSAKLKSKGDMIMESKIVGSYGHDKYPLIDIKMQIEDGKINYPSQKNKISLIDADLLIHLDHSRQSVSFVDFDHFVLKGKDIDINFKGRIDDIFDNAKVDINFEGEVDLNSLQNTIPFKEGYSLSGNIDSNLNIAFQGNDLKQGNYGNIFADGNLFLDEILIENPKDSLLITTTSSVMEFVQSDNSKLFSDQPEKVLAGRIDINDFVAKKDDSFELSTDKFLMQFSSLPNKDTTYVAKLNSKINVKNVKFQKGDSIRGLIKNVNGSILSGPSNFDPKKLEFTSNLEIDSVGMRSRGNHFSILKGKYSLEMITTNEKEWPLNGEIAFEKLTSFSAKFPLKVNLPNSVIHIKNGDIILSKTNLEIGKSDIQATGSLINFSNWYFANSILMGELNISSNLVDANQIILALNRGQENKSMDDISVEEEQELTLDEVETESVEVFTVPDNIDIKFESSFKEVLLKKFSLKGLRGVTTIKDQEIKMRNLGMTFNSAEMHTSLDYKTKDKQSATLGFDYKLIKVDLEQLIDLFPVLDSIMPMGRYVKGNVNFRIKGVAEIDQNLGMKSPTLNAISRIQGLNLVVMDSEMYEQIAKKLFFKDKTRNVIDEMSFALEIKDSKLEVFPSEFYVDRYRLALGGFHRLDNQFAFHISVLKTPVPLLKLGIDVKGTVDNTDYDMTSAKYKNFFSKKKRKRAKANQNTLRRKSEIVNALPF